MLGRYHPSFIFLEAILVDVVVAVSAERDQIFICVVTQPASRVNVVNLKTIRATTALASPTVALQHFVVEFAIRIRV